MKKVLTMMAVLTVAAVATADLAYFQMDGGKLFDESDSAVSAGTYVEGAVIMFTNLNLSVSGGVISIMDVMAPFATVDMTVGPAFAGGKYKLTDTFAERPSSAIGETAWLVFDPNGGGIQVGDFIGISSVGSEILDMAAAGSPAPADPQQMLLGDITANVQVIPEPATFGLMGIAGLGMFLARKKARR